MSECIDTAIVASFDGSFNHARAGAGFAIDLHIHESRQSVELVRASNPLQVRNNAEAEEAALLITLRMIVQLFPLYRCFKNT